MATPLYAQTFLQLLNRYPQEFSEFGRIHDLFKTDQTKYKQEFDAIGKPVVRLLEEAESRLCSKMENSSRSKYAASLSEKFRAHVRTVYPLIDLVGVTIS